MKLETERLNLRDWQISDAESLYQYAKDERVGPIAGWHPHVDRNDSLNILQNILMVPNTFAICLKEDNTAIGSISLLLEDQSNLDIGKTDGEIGYWIGVPFWGQGLVTEALKEIIRYGFVDLGLDHLWCGYFDGNIRSKRVQEKCGFIYHHTHRDIYLKNMDEIRTEHIVLLTRQSWIKRFTIRKCDQEEMPMALDLAWKVFLQYEAVDYSQKGIDEFYKTLHNESYLDGIEYHAAFYEKKMVGLVGIRTESAHICFYFVDGKYHRIGIGTKLFHHILSRFPYDKITLNSSPYGVPFYHSLGFQDTAAEQTIHGIRFTPMVYERTSK